MNNKVSIIIPVYNEEKYVCTAIDKIIKEKIGKWRKELIVIDDGSNDKTLTKLRSYLKRNPKAFKLLTLKKNSGKGSALKVGISHSSGNIVFIQDADLEYDPSDYQLLIKAFDRFKADAVYGSRFVTNEPRRVMFFWHYVANLFITFISNLLTNLNLTDVETGCKAFRGELIRQLAKSLESKRFGFEIEVTAKLAKIKNIKIFEVGISYNGRSYQEGKKIRWYDGLFAIWQIVKFNLFSHSTKQH